MYKHKYLTELWWNRPWVYIPEVIRFMKQYPYRRDEGHKFWIWLRNCLYLNWQTCLVLK